MIGLQNTPIVREIKNLGHALQSISLEINISFTAAKQKTVGQATKLAYYPFLFGRRRIHATRSTHIFIIQTLSRIGSQRSFIYGIDRLHRLFSLLQIIEINARYDIKL